MRQVAHLAGSDRNSDAFHRFAQRQIRPISRRNDETGQMAPAAIDALAKEGYLAPFLPPTFGGMGLALSDVVALHAEIGRCCNAMRSLLTVHGMVARAVHLYGSSAMKNRWLTRLASGAEIGAFCLSEPSAGSNPAQMQAEAVRSCDGWRLTGTKTWITAGQIATVFLVFARSGDGHSCFLVPRDSTGLTITPIDGLQAVRGSMMAQLEFEDCAIPEDALVGRLGFGFPIIATDVLTFGRLSVAAGSVGALQDCLDLSVAHARSRDQFGAPLIQHGLTAAKIGNMVVALDAARLLLERAAESVGDNAPDAVAQACIAKQFAARAAAEAATDAVQIQGARGMMGDADVFRHYRDARVAEIIEGSTEILSMLLATEAHTSCSYDTTKETDGHRG